jgi:LysR family transcriptional regulator, glycine cleavage system transcriptional activator
MNQIHLDLAHAEASPTCRTACIRSGGALPELQTGGGRARGDANRSEPSDQVAGILLRSTSVPPTAASHRAHLGRRAALSHRTGRLRILRGGDQQGPCRRHRRSTARDNDERLRRRWLVPRLPQWREAHPRLKLEIVGTDAVLSLKNGEADVSIRYARRAPIEGPSFELTRDKFLVVAAPALVRKSRKRMSPLELARFPLIEAGWPEKDTEAPTWRRWQTVARRYHKHVPDLSGLVSSNFREELHAIEAAISGQGIAICSNVLVAPELASGALVKLANVTLPGYGFYIVHRNGHPNLSSIKAFTAWAMAAA